MQISVTRSYNLRDVAHRANFQEQTNLTELNGILMVYTRLLHMAVDKVVDNFEHQRLCQGWLALRQELNETVVWLMSPAAHT